MLLLKLRDYIRSYKSVLPAIGMLNFSFLPATVDTATMATMQRNRRWLQCIIAAIGLEDGG